MTSMTWMFVGLPWRPGARIVFDHHDVGHAGEGSDIIGSERAGVAALPEARLVKLNIVSDAADGLDGCDGRPTPARWVPYSRP